jgi:GMP synthase-like glutamine amidotransferase
MILLIDLTSDELSSLEFVNPIKKIVESTKNKVEVVHYNNLTQEQINSSEKIILCGTSLKDNKFQEEFNKFEWIKNYKKPLLGICAGMQIIGLVYGAHLTKSKEIGMTQIMAKDPIFQDTMFSAYELHGSSVELPNRFTEIAYNDKGMQAFKKDNVYAIQFHPEVRNKKLIENFLNL